MLVGADANYVNDIGDVDLAVADSAGRARRIIASTTASACSSRMINSSLILGEVDDVLGASVQLGATFLAAKTLDFVGRQAADPNAFSSARTASNVKGLIMASTFFIGLNRVSQIGCRYFSRNMGQIRG